MPATPPPAAERLAAAARLVQPRPGLGAWNPLPLPRSCLVVLPPDGLAPLALRSDDGARHPLQAAEEGWLVQLALPGLAGTTLTRLDQPAPGALWEVSPSVLGNGRVRAEIDGLGRLARLCWDGLFADLAGPACDPCLDGAASVSVIEAGPVRARVAVRRESAAGRLDLSYSLLALDDHLLVEATWQGAGERHLHHPLRCAADRPDDELRWLRLADAGGAGLALAAAEPLRAGVADRNLRLRLAGRTAYALASPRRALGQLAEHLALPGQAGVAAARPGVRLAEAGALAPLWADRPEGWDGELHLAEGAGTRTRAWLMAAGAVRGGCWSVGPDGTPLAPCPASPEGDAWRLDVEAGGILRVRWRLPAPDTP